MLALTDNAVAIIRQIGEPPEVPDGTGLRISLADPDSNTMRVDTMPGPAPEDQVIEQDGGRLFLEPEAAELLSDMVLDARVDTAGSVEFLVAPQ